MDDTTTAIVPARISTVSTRAPQPLQPATFDDYWTMAETFSKSGLVPQAYRGKPADTLVAMQHGAEIGLQPLQSLKYIAVIQGNPALYGDAPIAICRSKPDWVEAGYDEHIEGDGDKAVAYCTVQRAGGKPQTRQYSVEDAKKAGLWGSARAGWKNHPKRMLQLRARAFALRDVFSHHLLGLEMDVEVEEYADYVIEASAPAEEPKTRTDQVKAAMATPKAKREDAAVSAVVSKAERMREFMAEAKEVDFTSPEDVLSIACLYTGHDETSTTSAKISAVEFGDAADQLRYTKECAERSEVDAREFIIFAIGTHEPMMTRDDVDIALGRYLSALDDQKKRKKAAPKKEMTPGEQSAALFAPADDDITDELDA